MAELQRALTDEENQAVVAVIQDILFDPTLPPSSIPKTNRDQFILNIWNNLLRRFPQNDWNATSEQERSDDLKVQFIRERFAQAYKNRPASEGDLSFRQYADALMRKQLSRE
mgnify:CR=1 FL=1